jgi:hypothetical protein
MKNDAKPTILKSFPEAQSANYKIVDISFINLRKITVTP